MGEIIAFKPVKDGAHPRTPSEGPASIVPFTGGWHAPMNGRDGHRPPDLEKAAWYKRCGSKFSRSIGPLWPLVAATLRGAGNRPGIAAHVAKPECRTIPEDAKRGVSS
jgi:hypothetical protein